VSVCVGYYPVRVGATYSWSDRPEKSWIIVSTFIFNAYEAFYLRPVTAASASDSESPHRTRVLGVVESGTFNISHT
jgi:hypothetical protein